VQRSFVALALATVLSIGGTRLSTIAIPWLVLTTTGSPVLTGLVGLAEMLPYVIAKALGGPLIDRIGARRIAIWADGVSVLAVATIPLLYWAGMLSFWALLPVVAITGVLRGPSDAAKQALVPVVATEGKLPLERVTGVLGASERLAGTLGAAVSGGLIALIGPAPALIANALTFAAAAAVLALGMRSLAVARDDVPAPLNYASEFREGWQMLRGDAVLMGIVVMVALTNLLDQAFAILLLPVWVQEQGLDVTWLGIIFAVFSGASIAGAAIAAAIGERLPRLAVYTVGFVLISLPRFGILATDAPMPAILAVMAVGGFTSGFINPIISAIMFERIPVALTGRVVALIGALAWALIPFGGLFGGVLVDGLGIVSALWICGIFYLAASILPLAMRSFRQMARIGPANP
jgi:MFS family permease